MFTGIITDIGTVRSITRDADTRIVIATSYDTASINLGASIACSGPCLSVVDKGEDWIAVDVSHETMARTTIGDWHRRANQPTPGHWTEGTRVNLERSLKVGDELGGHIVTGHIDGVGRVIDVTPDGASLRAQIEAPDTLAPLIAAKGSVALDGVSLTVNEVEDGVFGVNIIPHTREETTLGNIAAGQELNIEADILARYIARLTTKD